MIRVRAAAARNTSIAAAETHDGKTMVRIWYTLAGVCLLYYLCITAYAGIRLDAGWLWLAAALMLAGTGRLWSLAARGTVPGIWRNLTGVFWMGAAIALGVLLCLIFSHIRDDTQQDLDYVIILGAQVKKTVPSRSLRRRLEKALDYAQKHPDTRLILSGGQGSGEDISEAQCMNVWLQEHGLSSDRLILEDRSTSTYENLVFSDRMTGCGAASCGLVSNNFHIYRALKIAQDCGFKQAVGLAARSEPVLQAHYILRECAAIGYMYIRRFFSA